MHFTPVLALAGLAAAAPYNTNTTLFARGYNSTLPTLLTRNETGLPTPAPAPLPVDAPAPLPAGLVYRRGQTYPNSTVVARHQSMSAEVTNLSVQEKLAGNTLNVESITSVYFNLNGNITCTAQNPGTDGAVFPCGSTPYSFGLLEGSSSDFALELYHAADASYVPVLYSYSTCEADIDDSTTHSGKGDVPTYCHASGSSDAGSYEICYQVSPSTDIMLE